MTDDDTPLLDDLMPWSVAPPRPGRAWPLAADAPSLRARWAAFLAAGREERETLLEPSRARGLRSAVPQLPGLPSGTTRLAHEQGPCADPVRVAFGPFDERWLLPDQRLLDHARPELWRVADARQLFVVERGRVPEGEFPRFTASGRVPFGFGGQSRVRPLYRRPGGGAPNIAPGLLDHLGGLYGRTPDPEELPAWILARGRGGPSGNEVPLPRDGAAWERGVAAGRALLLPLLRGAHGARRPRLPGGRRPYVRAQLPVGPNSSAPPLAYDRESEELRVGEGGVISPVAADAWEFRADRERVVERWFADRTSGAASGLAAIGPAGWPQEWTSELLELLTVLALVAEADREARATGPDGLGPLVGVRELREAGVLPVDRAARRPASVLDHPEEGPDGQFALL
ncbi:DNA methyltransferase [Streptomyces tsukubensis]|uniref:DNA methyltransferase n=1 Tax=Streptomyces tsukubensis TaxID=83656 RepID=A0A1V4AFA1_9ACTN|nr:DNA methyltransferase [Streptomyces tsukubensis]QFR92832.1 DNA methyltransferase [Streptomyces tsukubensis]